MTTPIERKAKEKEIYVVDNHKLKGLFQITSGEYLIQQQVTCLFIYILGDTPLAYI